MKEAAEKLTAEGVKTNFLVIRWIVPFHEKEVTEILSKCKKKFSVEVNYTSQMAKYIRMETGIKMDAHINKYNGEPFKPSDIVTHVKNILAGKSNDLELTEVEAKDMAYHYLRTHYSEKLRPVKLVKEASNGKGEPVWNIEFAERTSGNKGATMKIGARTGTTFSFEKDA